MKMIDLYPPGSKEPVATHPDRVEYLKTQGFTDSPVDVSKSKRKPEKIEVINDDNI